jgi:hypothetical protein
MVVTNSGNVAAEKDTGRIYRRQVEAVEAASCAAAAVPRKLAPSRVKQPEGVGVVKVGGEGAEGGGEAMMIWLFQISKVCHTIKVTNEAGGDGEAGEERAKAANHGVSGAHLGQARGEMEVEKIQGGISNMLNVASFNVYHCEGQFGHHNQRSLAGRREPGGEAQGGGGGVNGCWLKGHLL